VLRIRNRDVAYGPINNDPAVFSDPTIADVVQVNHLARPKLALESNSLARYSKTHARLVVYWETD
jgi:hypothetical protein